MRELAWRSGRPAKHAKCRILISGFLISRAFTTDRVSLCRSNLSVLSRPVFSQTIVFRPCFSPVNFSSYREASAYVSILSSADVDVGPWRVFEAVSCCTEIRGGLSLILCLCLVLDPKIREVLHAMLSSSFRGSRPSIDQESSADSHLTDGWMQETPPSI